MSAVVTPTLLDRHRDHLRGSAISDEVIAATGYFSVERTIHLAGGGWGSSRKLPGYLPSLAYPVRGAASEPGHIAYVMLRPDMPAADANGKVRRYEAPPKSESRLDVHPSQRHLLHDTTERLWLVEGVKKRDALVTISEFAIAIAGVWNWKSPASQADMDALSLRGREVVIGFDSDLRRNHSVATAAHRFGGLLTAKGATVRYLTLEDDGVDKVGVDDYLASGGTLSGLEACLHDALPDPAATGSDPVELNDTGNARRLVALHGDDIRYVIDRGYWLIWNGTHWQRDTNDVELLRRSRGVSGVVDAEVAACPDDDRRKLLRRWATTSGEEPRRRRMIELARAEIGVGVNGADLDAEPWTLNVLNGAIDLRTGVLGPHQRRELITRIAPVLFDPEARSARFEGFLARILPDPAVREYIQRCIGYMLTGLTIEERWFLAYGPTAGGKSTLFEALRHLLGDYACTISSDAFMKRRDPGAATPEIARLDGIRFAVAFEVTRGRAINEGLVKSLTGGDRVVARELYTGPISFQPACKLVIAANDRPQLRDDDDAMWRRVLELPFPLSIPEAERDLTLKPELLDVPRSGPAILAWAVRGCLAWQRDALVPPAAVRAATTAYRAEMDLVGQFLEDACKRSDDGWTSTKQLVEAFSRWASANGLPPYSAGELGKRLRRHGFTAEETGRAKTRGWRGVALMDQG